MTFLASNHFFLCVTSGKGMLLLVENILDNLDVSSLENAVKVSEDWDQAISDETRTLNRKIEVIAHTMFSDF